MIVNDDFNYPALAMEERQEAFQEKVLRQLDDLQLQMRWHSMKKAKMNMCAKVLADDSREFLEWQKIHAKSMVLTCNGYGEEKRSKVERTFFLPIEVTFFSGTFACGK